MTIKERILKRSEVLRDNLNYLEESIDQISFLFSQSLIRGNKLLFCGNGGSAAESQHMAAEYCATLNHNNPRKGFAAIALTTDTSFLTAWSNDFGYETIFERQLETLGNSGDILICYTTSGSSKNICLAAEKAKSMDIKVVGFTGNSDIIHLEKFCDLIFKAPTKGTALIQEMHNVVGHEICLKVEEIMEDTA